MGGHKKNHVIVEQPKCGDFTSAATPAADSLDGVKQIVIKQEKS